MVSANLIGDVSGFLTKGLKASPATTSIASSGVSTKRSTTEIPKRKSTAINTVASSTIKRCTVCSVPHNSSIAHEKRLGLIRRPGVPSLFHRLAPELRALVYRHLTPIDILLLGMTSRSSLNLIESDVGEIIYCLAKEDGSIRLAHSLTRDSINTTTPTLSYFTAMSHRCHVAEALARSLAIFHLKEIYLFNSSADLMRSQHAHKIKIMVENLGPFLIVISHMLEVYRSSMLKLVQGKLSVEEMKSQARRSEYEIIRQYASNERVSLVFEFLKRILFRQLRPPSYATFLERKLRGWTEPSASDDKVMSLMVFGGIGAINHVLRSPTYNKRIRACEDWQSKARDSDLPRIATLQRVQTIFPNHSHFFDPWTRIESRGQESFILGMMPKPDTGEFQLWLRTKQVDLDFRLVRR